MKNMIKSVITCLFVFVGFISASADTGVLFNLSSNNSNTIELNLDENASGIIAVSILDQSGVIIFKEDLSAINHKSRKYNLEYLEAGNYTFQVDYNAVIKIQNIKKMYEGISLEESSEMTVFKPSFIFNENVVGINLLAFNGAFQVYILDVDGNVLHNEIHNANGAYKGQFDLNTLPSGNYTCRVYIDNKDFEGSFEKQFIIATEVAGL